MSLELLKSMGGCVATSEWTTGNSPQLFRRRPVPIGAKRYLKTDKSLPPKAQAFFMARPKVRAVIAIC